MPSATLPYKVIVTNKRLDSTAGAGMSSFEFLSLEDATAFGTKLKTEFANAYIYVWNGAADQLTEYRGDTGAVTVF